jgi:CRISPR system Cascade subunit CasA
MDSASTVLDPVFVVNGQKRSLPWILHALEDGTALRFDHLRPHQEHAWHLFLVRTAAMLGPTDNWNERLQAEGDIWDIEPGPGECGFFQPAGRIEDGYDPLTFIEQKDTPKVNGANHRYKTHAPQALDYSLYALVSAQTTSRYDGVQHRPSLRTTSGYGDRPYVSKVTGLSWADRFRSDVNLARFLHGDKAGIRFLWAHVFQDESISIEDCHPLMVDSSRRYRIHDGTLHFQSSWDWPIEEDPRDLHAELEDPWLPIDTSDGTAVGTRSYGFNYEVVRNYLAGADIKTPSLQQEMGDDCYFIAQSIAGTQGGSAGIHRRVVKLPADLSDDLFPEKDTFSERSEQYVRAAHTVKRQALRPALLILLGDSDTYSGSHLSRYEARVDQDFFPHLFEHASDELGVERWQNHLCDIAGDLFEDALQSCFHWEQKAGADTLFRSRISDLRSYELENSGIANTVPAEA